MSEGCTNCGNKGGCDHRKGAMFAAIDAALGELYPTRRFDERHEPPSGGLDLDGRPAPPDPSGRYLAGPVAARLAALCAQRLQALVVEAPPGADDYCRQIYVLCLGRSPSLVEVRESGERAGGPTAAAAVMYAPLVGADELGEGGIDELYLRVSVSELAPFAAVQQVRMRGERWDGGLLIEEAPRTGVFDPVLLPRFRTLVAAISEVGLRNLDFGDISAPPPGFEAGDYADRFGGAPALANYFFYPQPCSSITTTVVVL